MTDMGYIIMGISAVTVTVAGVFFFLKSRNKPSGAAMVSKTNTEKSENQIAPVDRKIGEFTIHMETLPAESVIGEDKLIEITDSKVLAHVNQLIPGLAQVANAANNAVQATRTSGEVLYRAIIPAGAKLANSKATEGAVRGIYHGANGISGHADWMAVKAQNGAAIAANTAAAAMGVASMVVGQYYMAQINDQLSKISEGISKISDFQDNEYRSRVFSLMAHVKKISDFQAEIIENDELRFSKISQLDNLEEECTQLLGLANLTLTGYTKKGELDYAAYEKELPKIQDWYVYQKSLMDILCKISELRYTLHLGAVSREQCVALLSTYTNQVADTQNRLTQWHQATAQRLKISASEMRRKRDGIDGAIRFIPGLFKDDLNFRAIAENTAKMIKIQTAGRSDVCAYDTSDLYAEDVQLIAKEGKIYYLLTNR